MAFYVKTDDRELLFTGPSETDFLIDVRFALIIILSAIIVVFICLSSVHKLAGV